MNKYNLGANVRIPLNHKNDQRKSAIATITGMMLDDDDKKTIFYKVSYAPSDWDKKMGSTGTTSWVKEDDILCN